MLVAATRRYISYLARFRQQFVAACVLRLWAFYCLRQIEKGEALLDQYESTLLYLSQMVDTVRSVYGAEQDADLHTLASLISEDFAALIALRNPEVPTVSAVRDNTLQYYENRIAAEKEKLDTYIAGINIQSLADNITDAIDAQTVDLEGAIASGNYELFQFLNESFKVTFDAFYGGIDLQEQQLNASIASTNSSLRQSLRRIALDTEVMRDYVQVFEDRMEAIRQTSGERINYLYEVQRAEADLAFAKAQINFIVSMVLDILTLPLMFLGPVGLAADVALAGVSIGVAAAIDARRRLEMEEQAPARKLQQKSVEDLRQLAEKYNFTYDESVVELFTRFGPEALQVAIDAFQHCEDTFSESNETLRLDYDNEPVFFCLESFNDLLYGVLARSVERDYAHGCPGQYAEYSGLKPSERVVRSLDNAYHTFSLTFLSIFRTEALAANYWARIVAEVRAHWECRDEFDFYGGGSRRRRRVLQQERSEEVKVTRVLKEEIRMKRDELLQLHERVLQTGDTDLQDLITTTERDLRARIYRSMKYRGPEALSVTELQAFRDIDSNLLLDPLNSHIVAETPDEIERIVNYRVVRDLPAAEVEDISRFRRLRALRLQEKYTMLKRKVSATYSVMQVQLHGLSAVMVGPSTRFDDITPTFNRLARARRKVKDLASATGQWPRAVAKQLPGRNVLRNMAAEVGEFLVARGIKGAALARQGLDALATVRPSSLGFTNGGKLFESPAAKGLGKSLSALGPAMTAVSMVLGPIQMAGAVRERERAKAQAAATAENRYAIMGQVMDEIGQIFERIVSDLQKLVLQAALASVEVECEEVFTNKECAAIDAGSANRWDDIAFQLIDFIEVQAGLCPLTSDYDLFEQDGFRRRQLGGQKGQVRNERFLGAIADKRAAEEAIAANKALYDAATERMHKKECPEFRSIIFQLTAYGKVIHTDIIAATEQARSLRTLTKQREATRKRKVGMSESFANNEVFNQAFIAAKLADIENTYADADVAESAKTMAAVALEINGKMEHLADVNEQNQIFRESCELLEYLRPTVPEVLGTCAVPAIGSVKERVVDSVSNVRSRVIETEQAIRNLFATGIYGRNAYNIVEEFALDITHKVDFQSQEWVTEGVFSFELFAPPDQAYRAVANITDTDTFAFPWFVGATSVVLYDIHFLFRDGEDLTQTIYGVNQNQVITDFMMGPKFTKTWVEPAATVNDEPQKREAEYIFALRDAASVEGGTIELQSRYFHNGDPSDTRFSDNLLNDNTAANFPESPLPSPYTTYKVKVDAATKDAIRTMISQRNDERGAVNVAMVVSYFFSPSSHVRGQERTTSPPPTTAAPTLTSPTAPPTLPEGSVAFGGYRDPTNELFYCDSLWTYRKEAGAALIDATSTEADNCLSIEDSETRPFNHGSQAHPFPATSTVVQQNIPPGYELDQTRWCSFRQGKCGGSSVLYRPDAQTPDGTCTTALEVREAWGFCMKPITPTAAPSTTPPDEGNETFALAGFRDPAKPLIECDETWSYRESGGEQFPEVFPDPVDNCLPIDTYQPFFKTDPNVDYDYDPSDNDVLQAIPPGYEILPDRWCSIKQNPGECGPTANSLYRPDATNAQGTCSLGETKRAWAFCVRPRGGAGGTQAPTPSTPAPSSSSPAEDRSGIGGFYSSPQACDTGWTYVKTNGNDAYPDADNCMSIEEFPPKQANSPDFQPYNTEVVLNTPVNQYVSGVRWCSVAQNACGKNNARYNRDIGSGSETCSVGQMQRAWVYCLYNITGNETAFPTASPTPEVTPKYPLAIGGYVDPAGGPVECDENPQYRATAEDVAIDAGVDGTFSFDPDDGQFPFINENNEEYHDYDETLSKAEGLPPNSYISSLRWCSIKQTICEGLSNTIYVREAEENPGASSPASAGRQRRAWGFAILPGVNPETRAPTTSPIPTPEPTTDAERVPRAVQGFTELGGDNVGVPCDTNWFYRAEQGGSLIAADSDGCMSIDNPATQPFRWATPDIAPDASAVATIGGITEVDYSRWCSRKQNTFGTGNNYYTNDTNTISGSATGPGQLMRAWGYCLKQVETGAPTPYPTSYPTTPTEPIANPTTLSPSRSPTTPQTATPSNSPTTTTPTVSPSLQPTPAPTQNLYEIGIYTAVGLIGLVILTASASYFTGATGTTGFITTEGALRFQPIRTSEPVDFDFNQERIQAAVERMF